MSVNVTFPDEVLVASREDRATFARRVTVYTLGHLYAQGKISSGFGARVLGVSRTEFYRMLSEHGFAVIEHDEDELAEEAQSSREIATAVVGQ